MCYMLSILFVTSHRKRKCFLVSARYLEKGIDLKKKGYWHSYLKALNKNEYIFAQSKDILANAKNMPLCSNSECHLHYLDFKSDICILHREHIALIKYKKCGRESA